MAYDLVGQKFGRLTVLRQVPNPSTSGHKERMYECVCENDDNVVLVRSDHLRSGRVVSCGCKRKEGLCRSPEEKLLRSRLKGMRSRCYNPKDGKYSDYGGRGISICEEWLNDPSKFVTWAMQNGFEPELSIDRIDNDGNYEPDNCRWTTRETQCNNKRSSHYLTVNDITLTVTQWERRLGLSKSTLYNLIADGGDQAAIRFISSKENVYD